VHPVELFCVSNRKKNYNHLQLAVYHCQPQTFLLTERKIMRKFSALLLAAVMGSAITVGTMKIFESSEGAQTLKIEHVDKAPVIPANYEGAEGAMAPFDFTAAAEKTMPAVVHIRSTQMPSAQQNTREIPAPFREFFGPFMDEGRNMPRVGSGSGVIINAEGYIVTNNHVIDNARDIEVLMNDNRSFKAVVIGTDPTTDLALIKVEADDLPYLSLYDSDQLKVGEWVMAVGNPFNLTSTVTAGIVSAKGRSIDILRNVAPGDSVNNSIESFIQTDAAINPGNSGGALVNLNGDLVGINTAIASPTGAYSGYGFAVPANIVKRVVEDLIAYGSVQRGVLGVQINNINADFAEENGLDVIQGAYVAAVQENTAAAEAGIKSGDVIVSIDGNEIGTTAELIGYIGAKRPGDKIAVKVNRKGRELTYDAVLRNVNGTTELIKNEKPEILTVLGAELSTVDEATLNKLKIRNGVRVQQLSAGKLRSETDMREGFVITRIDGKPVSEPDQVVNILKNRTGGVLIEGMYEGSTKIYYYGLGLG